MTDALKQPHPDLPFVTIVNDTITVLTTSSAIFEKKINKPPVQATATIKIKAARKRTISSGPIDTHEPSQT